MNPHFDTQIQNSKVCVVQTFEGSNFYIENKFLKCLSGICINYPLSTTIDGYIYTQIHV